MPLFSRKKTKKTEGIVLSELDEVLGYLDEIFRRRVPLSFSANKKNYTTDILFLESKTKSMRIQSGDTGKIPDGTEVTAGFSLDKTWWSFKTKFVLINEKPHLLIPRSILHNERRQAPRTNFSPREQVKVTIMEGLGSGNGVFGMGKDVSTEGMCLHIEKAMHLATEKEVPPSPALFKAGTKLAIVKINRIPGAPLLEISGIAKRVYRDGKWCFAFQFASLSKSQETMISRFIEPRTLSFKLTRRSLKRRQDLDAQPEIGSAARESSPKAPGAAAKAPAAAGPAKAPAAAAKAPSVEGAKLPGAAAPLPGAASEVEKVKIVVVGDLLESLAFLSAPESPFTVVPGNSPVSIIKALTDDPPKAMVCGVEFKGRSMLEVLEKITAMGVGKSVNIVICAKELPFKERIKFKMLNIDKLLDPSAGDNDSFTEKLMAFCK